MRCDVRASRSTWSPWICVASLVCAVGIGSPLYAAGPAATGSDQLRGFSQSVEALVRRTAPSVVQIVVSGYGPLSAPDRDDTDVVLGRQRTLGSGVIVDPDGYIVTNAHVVAGAQHIQVTLSTITSGD